MSSVGNFNEANRIRQGKAVLTLKAYESMGPRL